MTALTLHTNSRTYATSSDHDAGGDVLLPIVYHPSYSKPQLPPGHRFPMQIFRTIYDQLLRDKVCCHRQGAGPHPPPHLPTDEQLLMVHTPEYLSAFSSGTLETSLVRRIGFGAVVSSPDLIERTKAEVAGTLLTARLALKYGLACNVAGGTHHAFADCGSGYCILNDLAVTTEVLLQEGAVQRVLILDLDVHQGDGTASIFSGRGDVFTLSVHAANNFPSRKQLSTLDVPLPDGTDDARYMAMLASVLPDVLSSFKPQLVLYDAGVDVHESDALGKLALTDEGLLRREMMVLDTCLAAGIPVAGNVGGGYDADLEILARRHTALHRAASVMWDDHNLRSGTGFP
ncbi:MAG: hypothetical protein WDW38_005587 [Sanguina aurantia]